MIARGDFSVVASSAVGMFGFRLSACGLWSRVTEDVIEDLKEVAPALGFSGYQPLIRAYIGHGLRRDLARLERSPMQALTESLRKRGLDDQTISEVMSEANLRSA